MHAARKLKELPMENLDPERPISPEELARLQAEERARFKALDQRLQSAQLNGVQAFDVMRRFLHNYNCVINTDEVSNLLSFTGRTGDEFQTPVDVALYFDWLKAIEQVQNGDLAQ
jgi:hypothetical protein